MDVAVFALNNGWSAEKLASELSMTVEQAGWVYADIERKRKTTRYLHAAPVLLDEIRLGW
jgi:NAD+ synthase